ncbi:hypothetical protein [Mangrovimonas sp. TPBH4]|uniref:HYC_CC_PP family protein n=1 Tax=Mangrovimonas sp. TPBH4 TaxID=1645914 RepID=UPI000B110A15|nr:hypothetical protein [Mangrovimonas sp. TPBH4]
MKKEQLHKVFSVAMAILVLLSTISLTVVKHYCGDNLIDVAVFTEVEKCGMEMKDHTQALVEKKSCCKDEVEVVQGQDNLNTSDFDKLDFGQKVFLSSFVYSYINLFQGETKANVPHEYYTPPSLIADMQVLNQVFII